MSRIFTAGIDEIDPYKFVFSSGRMSFLNKPDGCLWGSTMLHSDYISDWIEWVACSDFHMDKYSRGISYKLKRNARICTVSNLSDYKSIMKKYSRLKYLNEEPSRFNERVIDWDKLSKDYDAFHLTYEAFLLMRLPYNIDMLIDDDGNYLSNFYSYDCETWILFNLDCINMGSVLNHCVYIPHGL